MRPDTTSERAGRFLQEQSGDEPFWAFHPAALPPNPPLAIDAGMQDALDRANQALGRLDGVTLRIPHPDFFLYSFVRKEAVLSSQIEGTQSSLSDLLLFELDKAPGAPSHDVEETSNYVHAMNHGMRRLEEGFPLSLRLIREIHAELLRGGRGGALTPGEFRRTQNWIGGSRPGNAHFVPPPAREIPDAMGALERFIHDQPTRTPVLLKAALAHAQVETIHPFLDGNGRVGRLLITLILCHEKVITHPLLYLSLYLKRHRSAYYDHLQRIRIEGAWEPWVSFFLAGLIEVAENTTETTRRLVDLFEADRARIGSELGHRSSTALRLHELLCRKVVLSVPEAARELAISEPTAYSGVAALERIGVAREGTGRKRNRLFVYDQYLGIVSEGTDSPPG